LRVRTSKEVTDIRPSRGLLDLQLDQIFRYRGLLATPAKRDVQLLYKPAALGAVWAVVQPVFALVIFTIAFGMLAKLPTPNNIPYPVFAFAAVLPWNYFAEGVRRGSTGLVNEAELVGKVYFPRVPILLSGVIAPLVDLLIGFGVLLVVMFAYSVMPTWQTFCHNSAVADRRTTRPIDVDVAWPDQCEISQREAYGIFPASDLDVHLARLYSFSMVPDEWKWVYSLNPMVGVIEGFRWAVTRQGHADLIAMGVSGALIIILLFSGLVFFKKTERSFVDLI
jgi:lipopolysaccharide transport system permease protein